jgi:hypothetical protein
MNEITQVIEEKFTRCPECRSFSVKQSKDLNLKEKIENFFVPVTVQICSNCSNRFVIPGKFSARFWEIFVPLTKQLPRKPFLLVVPGLAAAILVILLAVSGDKGQKPVVPTGKNPGQILPAKETPGQQEVKTEQTSPEPAEKKPAPKQDVQEKPEISSAPTTAVEIVLGNSNRFGVNWRPLGEGVQITRLSNGPLKRAGMLVGDILVEVDGKKVTGEGTRLENARNDVYHGKRSEVLIKVLRNHETLFFKLLKSK